MNPKLVKLPDGNHVNPTYVTNIELVRYDHGQVTKVWIVKDSGYGTGSFTFPGDQRDTLAKIING